MSYAALDQHEVFSLVLTTELLSSTTTPNEPVSACLLNRSVRVCGSKVLEVSRTYVPGWRGALCAKDEASDDGVVEREASELELELEEDGMERS